MKNLIQEVDRYAKNAVSGQDGTKTAFAVACKLWRNCADAGTVETAFNYYNSTKCTPSFSEKQIATMLKDARRTVGSEVGKYDRNSTASAPQPTPQATPQELTVRPKQVATNGTWSVMATRLLNKCCDDYSLKQDDHKWLENTRGIHSAFAYGVGIGYCVGNKEGRDYKLNGKIFGLTDSDVSIYIGYTLPIHNEVGELVGVVFIRPTQERQWRYTFLAGSQLMPFGVEWLRRGQEEPRLIILVEGTMNYLSLLQTFGGHHKFGRKVVVMGLPNANVYPDAGTLGMLTKDDVVCVIADGDTAGERCRGKWVDAISATDATCCVVEYGKPKDASKMTETKCDANDFLLNGKLLEWLNSHFFILNKKHLL